MAELDAAAGIFQIGHAVTVGHIDGRVQQLGNAVQRCFAAGGLFNQHRNRHDGPDDGLKVADVLHQLARVELAPVDEPAAVTEDNADDRFNKQGDEDLQQCGNFCIGNVDFLVFLV